MGQCRGCLYRTLIDSVCAGSNASIVPCGQSATFLLAHSCDRIEGHLQVVGQQRGSMCVLLSSLCEHKQDIRWFKFEGSKSLCRLALRHRPFPPLEENTRRDPFGFIASLKPNAISRLTREPLSEPWSAGRGEVWFKHSGASLKRRLHADKDPPLSYASYCVGFLPEKVSTVSAAVSPVWAKIRHP